MPDITMCSNVQCPLREDCYRFSAIPSEYRQAYSEFKPYDEGGDIKCDYQIKIKK